MKYYAISEKGSRAVNEDGLGYLEAFGRHLFVVADGLGGQGLGDVASRFAVSYILEQFSSADIPMAQLFSEALYKTHEGLCSLQKECRKENTMMSTAVLAAVEKDRVTVTNLGDSRVYLFFSNGKVRRTIDHSVPQMLALAGEIREKEIAGHPDRNKLLQALGSPNEELKFKIVSQPIDDIKAMLLCTDGFWEYSDEKTMQTILNRADSPQQWLKELEASVLNNAGNQDIDNYSAIGILMD